jgi:hypothetical protein
MMLLKKIVRFILFFFGCVSPVWIINYISHKRSPLELITTAPFVSALFLIVVLGINYFMAFHAHKEKSKNKGRYKQKETV